MSARVKVAVYAGAFLLTLAGVGDARDRRETVTLSKVDADHMRAGMQQYLKSVEGVVTGMANNNMKAVAASARKAGMVMVSDVSFEAALSVPSDFAMRSMETHQLFDLLADEAQDIGTKLVVTKRLGEVLGTCNSCHATYRLTHR